MVEKKKIYKLTVVLLFCISSFVFSQDPAEKLPEKQKITVDISYCNLELAGKFKLSNLTFNSLYSFSINEAGNPVNIEKIRDLFIGEDVVKSCISDWKLEGFSNNSRFSVYFTWKHGKGWIRQQVSGDNFTYVMTMEGVGVDEIIVDENVKGNSPKPGNSNVSMCNFDIPSSIKEANSSFNVTYSFKLKPDGFLTDIKKISDNYIGQEAVKACLGKWQFSDVPENRDEKFLAIFRWEPGKGWTKLTINGTKVSYSIEVNEGFGYEDPNSNQSVRNHSLNLRGEVKSLEIRKSSPSNIALVADLAMELLNDGSKPVIILKTKPPRVRGAALIEFINNSSDFKTLVSAYYGESIKTSPEWTNLRSELNQLSPPHDKVRVLQPNESWKFKDKISIALPAGSGKNRLFDEREGWENIKQLSAIQLRTICQVWSLNLEPQNNDRSELIFGSELQKRWKDVGLLWLEDIQSEPISLDLKTAVVRNFSDRD